MSNWRLIKACCIVFLALGAVCVIDYFSDSHPSHEATLEQRFSHQVSFETLWDDSSFEDMRNVLPGKFEEEVLSLSSYFDVQVSQKGKVVGFYSQEQPLKVFKDCSLLLANNGWVKVESGQESAASFIKESGVYTWLYLSCVSISNETAVVIQLG